MSNIPVEASLPGWFETNIRNAIHWKYTISFLKFKPYSDPCIAFLESMCESLGHLGPIIYMSGRF